jgi:rhodanese-related sulfurtransferase
MIELAGTRKRGMEDNMEGMLWAVAVVGLAAALVAARRSSRLAEEVKGLKRTQYEIDSRLKRTSEEMRETVEPLRLHLAKVASGRSVPQEMILNGRRYLDISAEEAQRLLERENERRAGEVLFVDVRTPKEYAVRRVAGAKLVPIEELEQRYAVDIPDIVEKVLVYCASGERSRLACDFLSRQGYTNLYHIQGGMLSWRGPTEGEGQLNLIQIQRK